jgi:hypothetical protein
METDIVHPVQYLHDPLDGSSLATLAVAKVATRSPYKSCLKRPLAGVMELSFNRKIPPLPHRGRYRKGKMLKKKRERGKTKGKLREKGWTNIISGGGGGIILGPTYRLLI